VYDDIVSTLSAGRPAPTGPVLAAPPAGDLAPAACSVELGLREIGRHAAVAAEKKALGDVLQRVRWNRKQAARALKVSYKTLLVKIAEYGLDDRPARRSAAATGLRTT
jgi:DNA-binding NtrC family response regulator